MTDRKLMLQALTTIAGHARHIENVAANRGDGPTQFVFSEIREMLQSMAELRRSPLLDELEGRLLAKPFDDAYYRGRSIAIAIAAILIATKGYSVSKACKEAAKSVQGISQHMVKKEGRLTASFTVDEIPSLDERTREAIETFRDIARIRIEREPSYDEILDALFIAGKAYSEAIGAKDWRTRNIKRAFNADTLSEFWRTVSEAEDPISGTSMSDALNDVIKAQVEP